MPDVFQHGLLCYKMQICENGKMYWGRMLVGLTFSRELLGGNLITFSNQQNFGNGKRLVGSKPAFFGTNHT